jgi:hypothetical protein
MPTPKDHEKLSTFMHRYMVSSEAKKSFPNAKQRIAVAESEYRARRKGK